MPLDQPEGYLAMPARGEGRPVLVLHAWWGLNDHLKSLCDRLAEQDFIAFAPDLYAGKVADHRVDAEALAGAVLQKRDNVTATVVRAARFLSERAGERRGGVAVIGFSLGAFFALDAAVADPERFRKIVIFYGTRPGDLAGIQAEILGHFAETDEFEADADIVALESTLRRAGCTVTFHRYAGTGHWFFEADRPDAFDQAAANLAWERTLAFLDR